MSAAATPHEPKRVFGLPILAGVFPVGPAGVAPEVIAGLTLAALGIPEVMGYSKIAQMPVVTGLYTILIPIAVFAVIGSSRHLVVGADSATAAILAAGLAGMAAAGSSQYVELAGMLALLTAGILVLARLLRLGFVADFLSRSVLIGFLTGVGIQVAMGQLSGMLGVSGGSGGTLRKFFHTLGAIPDASAATVATSAGVILVVVGLGRLSAKIPGALVAVVGAIAVSWIFDLAAHGVSDLGKVPGGLPHVGLPSASWGDLPSLTGTAVSLFVVILAQSAATSRAYAARYRESLDENTDMVGLGLANLSAALTGTFVVNGSPTKTEIADSAGGRTQITALTTAGVVLIVLLFLTVPLQYLPNAALATIVFLIGIKLVDIAGLRKVSGSGRRAEFAIALFTAATVVTWGVEQGILLAIVLSVIAHLQRSYKPQSLVLGPDGADDWRAVPSEHAPQAEPGLVVYRFAASLYFANTPYFEEQLSALAQPNGVEPKWICIDAAGIADVDYTGGDTLRELSAELHDRGVRVVVAEAAASVRAELDLSGVTAVIGEDAYYPRVNDVVVAYRATRGRR